MADATQAIQGASQMNLWSQILGTSGDLVSGILNYISADQTRKEAKDVAAQNRSDILKQTGIENQDKQAQLNLASSGQGFNQRMGLLQNKQGEQTAAQQSISLAQKNVVDKVNQSAGLRAQLLSLWK